MCYANQHHSQNHWLPVTTSCEPSDAGPPKPNIPSGLRIMKAKTVLIISLATNLVLLSTLAYIQSLSIDPQRTSPIIYVINRASPEITEAAVKAADILENELP